jgi:hypothetical protein
MTLVVFVVTITLQYFFTGKSFVVEKKPSREPPL